MKLTVLDGERFSCQSCTNCCRDWHVELIESEAVRLSQLAWADSDELHGKNVLKKFGGKTYLQHKPDGACIFLNEENGLCRVHEQFDEKTKPLGCRIFPFHITPTFNGEASVTGRCDCPTIIRNEGKPLVERRSEILQYANAMGVSGGFSAKSLNGLNRQQIERTVGFIDEAITKLDSNDERALLMMRLIHHFDKNRDDMSKPTKLRSELAGFQEGIDNDLEQAEGSSLPGIAKIAFRSMLTSYMRRDEDVIDGHAGRVGRSMAILRIVTGKGDFQQLGRHHKSANVGDIGLFTFAWVPKHGHVMDGFWRVVRGKMKTLQFMGSANFDADFFQGLRSLALMYPLVIATAKYAAYADGNDTIGDEQMAYAVASIEHSFGRSRLLGTGLSRFYENLLTERQAFAQLVSSL